MSRSRTKTKTKNPRKRKSAAGKAETDSGFSRFRLIRGKPKLSKRMRRLVAKHHLNSVITSHADVPFVNQQLASNVDTFYDGTPKVAALTAYDLEQMFINLESEITVPVTSNVATTRRLIVNFVKLKYTIRNQTNMPIRVTLYDCVARRDTIATNILASHRPADLWGYITEEENTTLGNVRKDTSFLGMTPFEGEKFVNYWKIGKRTVFMLHPGSNHVHYVKIRPGMIFNRTFTAAAGMIHGYTYAPLLVLAGPLVHDSVLKGQPVVGTARVDIMCEYHAEFQAVERSATTVTEWQSLGAITNVAQGILEDVDAVAQELMA